jgi:hypothetical protein
MGRNWLDPKDGRSRVGLCAIAVNWVVERGLDVPVGSVDGEVGEEVDLSSSQHIIVIEQ